ncbi:hypothetical protein [Nonomuraea sp. NPDC052265]|uniref:hypothetical protein n=1 Tax=Nonomuraea sp. NPDC052265 TaxID=3364374 RepID=UPI0037CB3AB4
MSAQAAGVLTAGVEPPPDSSEPSTYVAMSPCLAGAPRSACVIWPTFSASVIRASRSATRRRTGRRASR